MSPLSCPSPADSIYGINSACAFVVDCSNGRELGTAVVDYPSENRGIVLNPADHHLTRQNPAECVFTLVVENGGDALFQLKANQPNTLKHAIDVAATHPPRFTYESNELHHRTAIPFLQPPLDNFSHPYQNLGSETLFPI